MAATSLVSMTKCGLAAGRNHCRGSAFGASRTRPLIQEAGQSGARAGSILGEQLKALSHDFVDSKLRLDEAACTCEFFAVELER